MATGVPTRAKGLHGHASDNLGSSPRRADSVCADVCLCSVHYTCTLVYPSIDKPPRILVRVFDVATHLEQSQIGTWGLIDQARCTALGKMYDMTVI